ncbi:MAG: hypothetical protein IPM17_10310 [Verrucomicrobia bacterium]|nr:hypothetical protein [Verrucomicrobiota bacterium]
MKITHWSLGVIGLCVLGLVVQTGRLNALNSASRERIAQAEAATRAAELALSAAQEEVARLRADGERSGWKWPSCAEGSAA